MVRTIGQKLIPILIAGFCLFSGYKPVEALTETQVIDRLRGVPVFTLVTAKGEPVVLSIKRDGKENQVVRFFMSPTDADEALNQLKKAKPDLAKLSRVTIGSMPQFFELQKNNKDVNTLFLMVPSRTSIEAMRALLKTQGKATNEFNGIPLFYGISQKDKNDGLLTLEENGKKVTPFFFEQTDLQNLLNQYKKQEPSFTPPKIEVAPLDQILGSMISTPKNTPNKAVETFQFVPSNTAFTKAIDSQKSKNPPKK